MQHQLGLRITRRIYRDGLARALDAIEDMAVVTTTDSLTDLLRFVRAQPVNCVVVEVDRGEVAAADAIAALRQSDRSLRIVVLHELDRFELHRLHRVGADVFADRREGIGAIVDAVRGHAQSERMHPEQTVRDGLAPAQPAATLTPRETEVLELVSTGLTSRIISTHLGVSPKTIENHKQRIFHKLGVQNQGHAVATALRAGLIAAVPSGVVIDLRDRTIKLDDDLGHPIAVLA